MAEKDTTLPTVRKITSKTLGLKSQVGNGFKVIGRVRRGVTGQSEYGDFIRFRGNFEAQGFNAEGDAFPVVRSTQLILPSVAEDELNEVLAATQDEDPKAFVDFAFEVKLVAADSTLGREWVCESLSEPTTGDDPLAALRQTVSFDGQKPKTAPRSRSKK